MFLFDIWLYFGLLFWVNGLREYEKKDLITLREEVRSMFDHAYSSYLTYAYPYDELRSLSCDGFDTWGSFSLTLIDALDTLAVMGNFSEFRRVAEIISARANFEANINVSVFETNIRVVGGLLSAHLLSHKAGIHLEPGWPCNGPLLRLAEDMAKRLIAAFDTPTGMPYGTVNLKYGVPEGETSITCTAGIGTFLLEFGTLSRLTGDPLYEEVAMNAIKALHYYKSNIGLVGNHVDVLTGHWTAQDSGIGAGVDSYFEYLAKGTLLFQEPLLGTIFHEHKAAIEKYIRREDWHLWVSMTKGQVTLPVFQSLDAYWPGVLSLFGEIGDAMKSLHNYHRVWKQFGFTPEFYNIPQAEAGTNREGYPLRPELIESVMYLYRATGDPYLIQVGVDILRSLQHSAKTTCGYATINDVRDHRKADRMESFFLAETTKYLYLLFDPDNFIHNSGQKGEIIETQWGQCIIDAGGYIFNTEAHPIDPGALYCCHRSQNLFSDQKATLWKFIPVNDQKEKDNTEHNIFHLKNIKNKNNEESIEIVKLSEMRHTFTNDIENNNDENSINPLSAINGKVDETIKIEEDKININNPEKESLKVQVAAPPSGIYKADDSENIDTYETYSTSDEHYSTPAMINNNESFIKQNNIKLRFEPQLLLENIRKKNLYPTNNTAKLNYHLLSCQSQSFLQRISIIGEFF
ncbi:ER degradation-enhancing alpha-mannosidase-like protein 2 [Apis mellifera caucasica]|uniref:alpha-1,2-Mannosidase n=1 Tax=Apis mellifera TaxID=7460 RepID=A0A7M7G040_APIME|nr:ER degradation-enhancing alpha-mannosidase-like protein 2 [Apis mellifera]KAG6803046.1 ER degradation-enhancing alpha-mannosidase-like protein 2 [Apis mellifera caucasica]KAG9431791.1 ER degradation-enhancing alpha-mannosidase-like protein 2 [Apis mellifera carnica]|eukprot:XP_001122669.2 ER degradation-enhancing alpha-mannosidase-like protein 2 [Apis mellifera]